MSKVFICEEEVREAVRTIMMTIIVLRAISYSSIGRYVHDIKRILSWCPLFRQFFVTIATNTHWIDEMSLWKLSLGGIGFELSDMDS